MKQPYLLESLFILFILCFHLPSGYGYPQPCGRLWMQVPWESKEESKETWHSPSPLKLLRVARHFGEVRWSPEGQVIANTMWPLAFWTAGMCGEQDGLHSCFPDTLHSQRRVDCQGAGRLVSQAVSGRRDCCFSVRDAMCYVLSPATEGRWKSFLCMSVSQRIQLS